MIPDNEYIAHISGERRQTVLQHNTATAELGCSYAVQPLKQLMYYIGYYHDLGKCSARFQLRINGKNIKVEHSICGADAVRKQLGDTPISLIAELCIAGHHTGLPDIGSPNDSESAATLRARLNRPIEDYSAGLKTTKPPLDIKPLMSYLEAELSRDKEHMVDKYSFITRYCFSCLVDADSVDTRTFCDGKTQPVLLGDFSACIELIKDKLGSFKCETPLQKARGRLQKQAYDCFYDNAGIKLMNLPTGSGKTLCSIYYAMNRAVISGKKRIIYVAPMNAIIDQTASVFEDIFSKKVQIVRHQSTFSYDDIEDIDEDYRQTLKYACENWDCPIVITTAVQFFESIYGNRRGKLRKLHNMADSIIILDEAHMMPVEYLQPCLQAVSYITGMLNSEAILLTATMPDFPRLFHTLADSAEIRDLIADKSDYTYFGKYKCRDLGAVSEEALLGHCEKNVSSLVIVNSRKRAGELYKLCPAENKYHLSTYMTAYDRMNVIKAIREKLEKLGSDYPRFIGVPPERRIVLFSTSLIEAGVDLDFTAVYRELAGLDNLLQSGGRCNREGKLAEAYLNAFMFDEGGKYNTIQASITKSLLGEYDNVNSPECITEYYDRLLYTRRDETVSNTLSNECRSWKTIPFKTYAENFHMIDDRTVSIFVPRDDFSEALRAELRFSGHINSRKIQKYLASVYPNELDELYKQGVIDDYGSGIYCLENPDYYDSELGIQFEGKDKIV